MAPRDRPDDSSSSAPLPTTALLRDHPLYGAIRTPDALRTFMEHHVAAVWDFMSLLKSLQRDLACVRVPWVPPADPEAARLVNEIVLGEETDAVAPSRHLSHFEWYLEAMDEVGADSRPVRGLVTEIATGAHPSVALAKSGLPVAAVAFTSATLRVLHAPTHVRAAVFLHAREDLIPKMFLGIVEGLEREGLRCATFLGYLRRHIAVDAGQHGPLATALLDRLHAGDADRQGESAIAVERALAARLALWDAALSAIRD